MSFEYFAFISYSHKDKEKAKWIQYQIEHYHLPSQIIEVSANLPKELRPLFRDDSELSCGILSDEIIKSLNASKYLIVLCTQNSFNSVWVNSEVRYFIDKGKYEYIIPIVESDEVGIDACDYLPQSIKLLKGGQNEILAINMNEFGKEATIVKVVAKMLGIRFDLLWRRYEREKEEEHRLLVETNNKIKRNLSRYVSKEIEILMQSGFGHISRRLALELFEYIQNVPNVPEAISVLLQSRNLPSLDFNNERVITSATINREGKLATLSYDDTATDSNIIEIYDINTGKLLYSHSRYFGCHSLAFGNESSILAYEDLLFLDYKIVDGEKMYPRFTSMGDKYYSREPDEDFCGYVHRIVIWNYSTNEVLNIGQEQDSFDSISFNDDDAIIVAKTYRRILSFDIRNDKVVKSISVDQFFNGDIINALCMKYVQRAYDRKLKQARFIVRSMTDEEGNPNNIPVDEEFFTSMGLLLRISDDGRLIAIADKNNYLHIFSSKQEIVAELFDRRITSLLFERNSDGIYIGTASGISYYSISKKTRFEIFNQPIKELVGVSSNNRLLTITDSGHLLAVSDEFNLNSDDVITYYKGEAPVLISSYGKYVVALDEDDIIRICERGSRKYKVIKSFLRIDSLKCYDNGIIVISSDIKDETNIQYLLRTNMPDYGYEISKWDYEGNLLWALPLQDALPNSEIYPFEILHNGNILYLNSAYVSLVKFTTDGKRKTIWKKNIKNKKTLMAISPDEQYAIVLCDNMITRFCIKDGVEERLFQIIQNEPISNIAINNNNELIAIAYKYGNIEVWDIIKQQKISVCALNIQLFSEDIKMFFHQNEFLFVNVSDVGCYVIDAISGYVLDCYQERRYISNDSNELLYVKNNTITRTKILLTNEIVSHYQETYSQNRLTLKEKIRYYLE